jgi:hypothetical protein
MTCLVVGFNPFTWLWANPLLFGQFLVLYAGVGLVWACVKWSVKLRKARVKYVTAKSDYLRDRNGTEQDFIDLARRYKSEYAPTVERNKGNIGFWCMWWPFSMVAFIFEDMIREVWNLSWKFLSGFFGGMRKRILGEASRDLD